MPDDGRLAPLDRADAWIFDLDNTLYRMSERMVAEVDNLMNSFVRELCGLGRDDARRLQKRYYEKYGLTLRGLMLHHGVDPEGYERHLSPLDLSEIGPDPGLGRAIDRLPGRKFVHTNMFLGHAEKVIDRLGLAGRFDGVFDIAAADYLPKPAVDAYRRLCRIHGVDPGSAVMFEDLARNLEPAAELGMATVWLRPHPGEEAPDHVDHAIDDLAAWLGTAVRGAD